MAKHPVAGTEFQSGDGAVPEKFTTIGKITNLAGPNLHNPAVEGSGIEDLWKVYVASQLVEIGPIILTVRFDPNTTEIHDALMDRAIAKSVDNYVVCWSNLTANNFVFLPADVTVAADTIDEAAHGLHTGQPIRIGTDDTMPLPLVANTTYYAIYNAAGVIEVAATNANAVLGPGVAQIDITTQGVGNHAVYYGQRFGFAAYIVDASPEGSIGGVLAGNITLQPTCAMTVTL